MPGTTIELTDKQRELVRHAIGLNGVHKTTFRNSFVTGKDSDDHADWMDMVKKGYAYHQDGTDNPISGGSDIFWVRRETALAVKLNDEHLGRDWKE